MLPVIFKSESMTLYSYPFFIGLAWGIAYQVVESLYPKNLISKKFFWGLIAGNFIFAWVGAKLFFLIFSAGTLQRYYLSNPEFWMGGGMVFYGGLVVAAVYTILYGRFVLKIKFATLAFLIPGLTVGHGIGRLGCLLAGCCFGKTCELWGKSFQIPTQLLESIFLGILSIVLIRLYLKGAFYKTIGVYFYSYSLWRFLLEFLRDDFIRGSTGPFSTSQWISLGIFLLTGIAHLIWAQRKE